MLDRCQLTIEGYSLSNRALFQRYVWLCELSEDSCATSFDIYTHIYISKYREVEKRKFFFFNLLHEDHHYTLG